MSAPTKEAVAAANFGAPPVDPGADIRRAMSGILKDPYSAVYRIGEPVKGYSRDGWAAGRKEHYGYLVPAYINAKNSYGGYVGEKQYFFLFADGMVYDVTAMMSAGMAMAIQP